METTVPTNTAAVVSLVAGILAWVAVPVIGGIVAVFAGHTALNQLRASGGLESGEGLAVAGLVLGWLQLALLILALLGWIVFAAFAGLADGLAVFFLVGIGLVVAAGLAALLWLIFLGVA